MNARYGTVLIIYLPAIDDYRVTLTMMTSPGYLCCMVLDLAALVLISNVLSLDFFERNLGRCGGHGKCKTGCSRQDLSKPSSTVYM